MSINELIRKLEETKEKYGDIQIGITIDDKSTYIREVEIENWYDEDIFLLIGL